ncbi:MAG: hypothetical protein ABMA26_22395 [Limisphaerales bacterium]
MKAEDLFQRLVIASTALFIGYSLVPWLLDSRLQGEVRDALSWNGFGAKLPRSESIWLFVALVRVLVTVGLCQFSREARGVFVVIEVYFGVTSLLGGLAVSTATESVLLYLMNLCEGAVLVMSFTPPLRDKFTTMRLDESSGELDAQPTDGQNTADRPPERGS